jgi:hypothetical protein
MRRMKWFPILFLAAAIAAGCSNGNGIKDLKFSERGTDNNWRDMFKSTIKSNKLSREETTLLQGAMLREAQQIPPSIAGKTVRQVIEDQREWNKAHPPTK